MNSSGHDVDVFVRWVCLDCTERPPSGKRQQQPMRGFWMQRFSPYQSREVASAHDVASSESRLEPPPPNTSNPAVDWSKLEMKGSDLRLRRYICIEAHVTYGHRSVEWAASELSSLLGDQSESNVNVYRTGYYDVRKMIMRQKLSESDIRGDLWTFPDQFFTWRDHTLQLDKDGVEFEVSLYSESHPAGQTRRLKELMTEIRTNPQQADSHRVWMEEQTQVLDKRRAIGKMESAFLLGNLNWCASLHHRLGRPDKALPLLREALQILESEVAEKLPDRQEHIDIVEKWIRHIDEPWQ